MKFKLSPGAELDVLTQSELEETLSRIRDELRSGFSRPAITYRDFNATTLDSNGNSGILGAPVAGNPTAVDLFEVKQGYGWRLHRLAINAEGVTPGTQYVDGYLLLMRSGRLIDFAGVFNGTAIALSFPVVFTYTSDAPLYNNGETVQLLVSGGPAATNLICDLQVTLEPAEGKLTLQ